MGASASMRPTEIVGISYAREIGSIPSAMGNGLLTSEKWAKMSSIKGNSVVDGEQILSYQQWGGDIEIKTVGLNQWDEEWEVGGLDTNSGANNTLTLFKRSVNYTQLAKNTNYYCAYSNGTSSSVWLVFYDLNGIPIYHPVGMAQSGNANNVKNRSFITPNQDCTVRFYTKNEPDSRVCLHLVQDGIVSQYKPYTSTTTPLPNVSLIKDADGNQLFPYGLCSAGSVYDEITETKAIKRVGVVDMGTQVWSKVEGMSRFTAQINGLTTNNGQYGSNVLISLYTATTINANKGGLDKSIAYTAGYISIVDTAYIDVDSFKQAMQGVLLYYPLATPIEVDIDKWKAEYKVEQGGTEQIVSANDTTNLKADIIYGNKM
jgi:hypothetical protein